MTLLANQARNHQAYVTSLEIAPAEFGVGLRCVCLACAGVLALSGWCLCGDLVMPESVRTSDW